MKVTTNYDISNYFCFQFLLFYSIFFNLGFSFTDYVITCDFESHHLWTSLCVAQERANFEQCLMLQYSLLISFLKFYHGFQWRPSCDLGVFPRLGILSRYIHKIAPSKVLKKHPPPVTAQGWMINFKAWRCHALYWTLLHT